jgi:hypothetical protein
MKYRTFLQIQEFEDGFMSINDQVIALFADCALPSLFARAKWDPQGTLRLQVQSHCLWVEVWRSLKHVETLSNINQGG